MNLDAATLERLMAYADGELDDTNRAEVEALLQSNEDAARDQATGSAAASVPSSRRSRFLTKRIIGISMR